MKGREEGEYKSEYKEPAKGGGRAGVKGWEEGEDKREYKEPAKGGGRAGEEHWRAWRRESSRVLGTLYSPSLRGACKKMVVEE